MKHAINTNCRIICAALLACALMLPIHTSLAGTGFGEDIVNFKLGAFLSDFDTKISLTGPADVGRGVGLEDVLGLEPDQATFRGELMWRFAPRHRIILGYYSFERSATAAAQQQVIWEFPNRTIQFDVGTTVASSFDWQLVPFSYAYSFYKTDKLELAAQFGVHWFDLDIKVAGDAIVNNSGGATFVSESTSASGPLPVIGLHADYALAPKWLVGGHLQYFGLDYDVYTGELVDARIQTEYRVTDNFHVGLGYTWYDARISKRQDGGFEVGADYVYNGLEAYIGFRF